MLLFLSLNLNSKNEYHFQKNYYKNAIWSDAAGYYVYLPATFIYGWEIEKMPADLPVQLGNGFEYTSDGKLKTKYSSGTAMAELPFFLAGHAIASLTDYESDGVSAPYHLSLYISGIFYLLIGLYFLFRFLQTRFRAGPVVLTLLLFLLGTNLYFYALNSPGYSHIYSFAGYALILWLSHCLSQRLHRVQFILLAMLASWVILIRPTAFLFVLFVWWYFPGLRAQVLKVWSERKGLFIGAFLAGCLVWVPQFMYWNYLSGSPLFYSYEGEGFGWPQLHYLWFSTKNGLFVYAPILLFSVVGLIMMYKKHKADSIKVSAIFLISSLVFSSWWCWWYGCSYGSRSFVEFLVPLSIPFCFFVQQTFWGKKTSIQWLSGIAIATMVFVNLKIIYKYDDCFHGDIWDAEAYFKLIF